MYVRTYYNWTSKQLFGNPRVRACFRFLGHFFRFRQEDTLCSVNMHINQVTHDWNTGDQTWQSFAFDGIKGSEKIWNLWTGWTGKLKANPGRVGCSWSSLGNLQMRRLHSFRSIPLLAVLHGFIKSLAHSANFTCQIWVFSGSVSTAPTQNRSYSRSR